VFSGTGLQPQCDEVTVCDFLIYEDRDRVRTNDPRIARRELIGFAFVLTPASGSEVQVH
jgi:hypothetical protein